MGQQCPCLLLRDDYVYPLIFAIFYGTLYYYASILMKNIRFNVIGNISEIFRQ